jgi:aconitate hydratase
MGCIGMGQAPASGQNSLRTMPRNFPGRSGTKEDSVWLCSPETAAASALTGRITDPRELEELYGMTYPRFELPADQKVNTEMLVAPPEPGTEVQLIKGPNISSLPEFDPLPDQLELPVLLKVGDNISTDEILPAGQRVLPFRSNIPKISEFTFEQIDAGYHERAASLDGDGHAIIGGVNYGQGSSREHAALAPRFLGLRVVIAKDFARIHWQNLVNFGVLPLEFEVESDHEGIERDDVLVFDDLHDRLRSKDRVLTAQNATRKETYRLRHRLSPRQVEMVVKGGLIPVFSERLEAAR